MIVTSQHLALQDLFEVERQWKNGKGCGYKSKDSKNRRAFVGMRYFAIANKQFYVHKIRVI